MDSRIIKEASEKTELPENIVNKVYNAYWQFVKSTMKNWDLKKDMQEEEFDAMRPCINIPSLGKLKVDWKVYNKLRNSYKKNEDKED